MKLFKTLLLAFTLMTSAYGAGAGKLIDLLLNESGLVEYLAKHGVDGVASQKVSGFVRHSLVGLNMTDKVPTKRELTQIITALRESGDDGPIKRELLALFDKPVDQLSKEDFAKAVDHLLLLSSRYGVRGSTVLACGECVGDVLARNGFRYTLEEAKTDSVKFVMNNILPKTPKERTQLIGSKMRALGYGDLSRASKDVLGPEDEKLFGAFILLAEKGSKATKGQREFIEAIVSLSTDSAGKVDLLASESSNKLWRMIDLDETKLSEWTVLLRDTAEEAKSAGSNKEAFFKTLEKRAGDDATAQEWVSMLRTKNCFFR
jgi:hypothetical protein